MTTIAFKDGILAADSRAIIGDIFVDNDKKIHESKGKYYAGSGASGEIKAFIEWKEVGVDEDDRPCVDSLSGLLVLNKNTFSCDMYDCTGEKVIEDIQGPMAIGSGMAAAMGAMYAGASAVEAVEIAKRLDINSGGNVVCVGKYFYGEYKQELTSPFVPVNEDSQVDESVNPRALVISDDYNKIKVEFSRESYKDVQIRLLDSPIEIDMDVFSSHQLRELGEYYDIYADPIEIIGKGRYMLRAQPARGGYLISILPPYNIVGMEYKFCRESIQLILDWIKKTDDE